MRNTFKAYERLKREQHIDTLFRTGKAYSVLSLRFTYHLVPRNEKEISPVRIGFSVAKKKFRKAVQRNRIKRLLKECWRLNKQLLYLQVPDDVQLHLFVNYTHTEMPEFDNIQSHLLAGIEKLKKEIDRDK